MPNIEKNERDYIINFLKTNKLSDRVKIDTGFACNINCFFCYYKNNLNDPFMDLKTIQYQLTKAKYLGFKKIDFSGGESSYHPDFFNFLKKAKELKFYISTLSNGIKFSDIDFIKKSKDNGLNEILFSIHGLQKTHDLSTRNPDSFKKLLKSIENALKLGINVRLNTTIHNGNLKEIYELYKFLRKNYDYKTHNFIFINTFAQNKISMNYKNKKDKFKNLIHKINDVNPDFKIRYLPFCMISEEYHTKNFNYLQHFIDGDDWFPGFIYYYDFEKKDKKYFNYMNYYKYIKNTRNSCFYKDDDCKVCPYNFKCDGYKK